MASRGKVVSLSFLFSAALVVVLGREIVSILWAMARLSEPQGWILAPSDIIALVLGVLCFVILIRNEKACSFISEVATELEKVAWPDRKETVLSTGVVSVLVGICALVLFGFDMVWGMLVSIFYQ